MIATLLAAASTSGLNNAFGTVKAPAWMGTSATSPEQTLGTIIGKGLSLFITFAGLIMLGYLLWGAFDWITSGGEKDKISKAQGKITNALIGMILIFVMLAVFVLVAGDILGVVTRGPNGSWSFKLPSFGSSPGGPAPGGAQAP